jgi:hypothetical protein
VSSLVFGSGKLTVLNNTIADNSCLPLGVGGGVYVDDLMSGGSSLIANNIVSDNDAFLGGGVDHSFFFGEIRYNALSGNAAADLYNGGGSAAVIEDNLFVEPSFVAPAAGNYRLRQGSLLIDAADPGLAPDRDSDRIPRPVDGDGDMLALPDLGAYEYPSGEVMNLRFLTKNDLTWEVAAGQTRFNLYRGTLRSIKLDGQYTVTPGGLVGHVCGIDSMTLPFNDPVVPAMRVLTYLVTWSTPAFEASLGADSDGALRPNHVPCP